MAAIATGGSALQLVGVRDLKNMLSHYLNAARKGDAVIITDRGVPVAILHTLDRIEENAGPEERLAYLAGQGFVTLPKKREPTFGRVERAEVMGEPVSETIIKDRR